MPKSFADAEKFLAGGRNKNDRPVQNNTRLRRIDADTIALVLHTTAVVTYHRDGTFTIYGGGWNSVTTKSRIREHSPARPYSDGHGAWVVGDSGARTPARVQKCRTCRGRGTWMEDDVCSPAWHRYCRGSREVHDVPYVGGLNPDGTYGNFDAHHASRRVVPCDHGEMSRHVAEPCEHLELKQHVIGQSQRTCHRCHGDGTVDYGSKVVPVTVTASEPYKVDPYGGYLGDADHPATHGYGTHSVAMGTGHHKLGKSSKISSASTHLGGEVADRIASVLPGINAVVTHPVTGSSDPVRSIIVSLNDSHGWTRQRVADWLDTLDVDLTF